jgi:hypothetical protein
MKEIQYSPQYKRKKIKKRSLQLIVLLALGSGVFYITRSCKNISPDPANLALTIEGKTYLQSRFAKEDMTESCTPDYVMIYKDDDEFFITLDGFDPQYIVDAMAGNVDLFDYQEVSYEGYFEGSKKDTFITRHSEFQSTETIGEQIRKESATIRNRSNEKMEIKWSFNQKNGDYKAEKNCEIHAFWYQTVVAPGETAYATQDHLVISLEKLAQFYDCTFSYDRDTRVLFITLK